MDAFGEILDKFHQNWHFQQMVKVAQTMKEFEIQAGDALRALLEQVPVLTLEKLRVDDFGPDQGVDIVAEVAVGDRLHVLACEIKSSGQPRHARAALAQLRSYAAQSHNDPTLIFIAPYLSPESQALCRDEGIGFLDLEGNARIIFGSVFIERSVPHQPAGDRRGLRSLFKPKSAQVLRVMLREPKRIWRVTELAEAAEVSLGHVSNVRTALRDREWIEVSSDGMELTEPRALLDAWRDAYEEPSGRRLTFYTTMHGKALEEAVRHVLGVGGEDGQAVYASFSAAQWLAPYGRTSTRFFYADWAGVEELRKKLDLRVVGGGENVVVVVPKEGGIFRDVVKPASDIVCTSPVQTYLDLSLLGEMGRESAEYLRREKLTWPR